MQGNDGPKMNLAKLLAQRLRDEIAGWVHLSAPQSKRLGNALARLLAGPVLASGRRRAASEWRHELTADERRARGQAVIDGLLPAYAGPYAELRLLLERAAPDYQRPICRKCGEVTAAMRCIWTECPLVDPKARDFIWVGERPA
jgi:hypothetical protein